MHEINEEKRAEYLTCRAQAGQSARDSVQLVTVKKIDESGKQMDAPMYRSSKVCAIKITFIGEGGGMV